MNEVLFSRMRSEAVLSSPRRWNGNDRSDRNHNGAVPVAEDPLDIVLTWKESPSHQPRSVGAFRLHLQALLEAGYIRKDTRPAHVRLRFFHDTDEVIYIETSAGKPRLPVGNVG
jgi:hypothetical protein